MSASDLWQASLPMSPRGEIALRAMEKIRAEEIPSSPND